MRGNFPFVTEKYERTPIAHFLSNSTGENQVCITRESRMIWVKWDSQNDTVKLGLRGLQFSASKDDHGVLDNNDAIVKLVRKYFLSIYLKEKAINRTS